MIQSLLRRLGYHPATVWAVKHIISPVDRVIVRASGGRIPQLSSIFLPTLLLTTVGRHSGRERTIPLIYIQDGDRFVVANARPVGERPNPWVTNLRASRVGVVTLGGRSVAVAARELDEAEVEIWWPALKAVWPAFDQHYAATGERTVFMLDPAGARATNVG